MGNILKPLEKNVLNITDLPDKPNDAGMTPATLKSKFDEAGETLKQYTKEDIVEPLLSEDGSFNIGHKMRDGTVKTVREQFHQIEESGTGTIPPDGTITRDKLVDNSVTMPKLDEEVQNAINTALRNASNYGYPKKKYRNLNKITGQLCYEDDTYIYSYSFTTNNISVYAYNKETSTVNQICSQTVTTYNLLFINNYDGIAFMIVQSGVPTNGCTIVSLLNFNFTTNLFEVRNINYAITNQIFNSSFKVINDNDNNVYTAFHASSGSLANITTVNKTSLTVNRLITDQSIGISASSSLLTVRNGNLYFYYNNASRIELKVLTSYITKSNFTTSSVYKTFDMTLGILNNNSNNIFIVTGTQSSFNFGYAGIYHLDSNEVFTFPILEASSSSALYSLISKKDRIYAGAGETLGTFLDFNVEDFYI